ncbi:MAG: elongation factor G [Desulfobacterales bacterium]|jgi:elongation factor G|nr:elongation factor G [Desulfobacterales bacterium]MDP6806616.1 elongation factor G [Desulfobacterales bacterium]|tara:strand:+ start:44761 stop:46824 length:2064 start_codon:yes stop_codon:yes gene_type:complete
MIAQLRNVVLVAHGGAGKTSLAEAVLLQAGVIKRRGHVEDGNTVMDFEPEEIKRQSSISTGLHQYVWNKHVSNIIDTPGDQNFFADTKSCMQGADSAVVVLDVVDGVKVQTEQAWNFAEDLKMPCVIFINKLDRERADFFRAFKDASKCFETKPIALQLPIGSEESFKGVVDLIGNTAYIYNAEGERKETDIPADMKESVEKERETLVENIAETDDELLERYLEGESIPEEDIRAALRKGTLSRSFVPVLCGSAINSIGVDLLMNFINETLPSPIDLGPWKAVDPDSGEEIERAVDPDAPFSALVFKTVTDPYSGRLSIFKIVSGNLGGDGNFYNVNKGSKERFSQLLIVVGKEQKVTSEAGPGAIVAVAKLKDTTTGDTLCSEESKIKFNYIEPLPPLISFAIQPKSTGDEDKIFASLSKILEEDIALKLTRNAETKEILLSGMGQVHIAAAAEKLKRKFNVEVNLNQPKVPYKETIKKKVRVQGKHKKQTGGHGQYGVCWIQLEPLPRGKGFEFVDAIVGGAIPKTYIPAVEKGIIEASQKGILAGFPCIDFRVILDDGSFHAVDSSEMAFKIAGSLAYRKAAEEAQSVLLEPIMDVTITAPDEFMGDIMGDLNSRRGRVLGMDSKDKNQVIRANVPMAEFLTYAPDLNSMTGGRGMFTMELSRYDEVPAQIAQKVIEEIKKDKN